MSAYAICNILIKLGRTTGLQDKMDAYLAADRLTTEEYNELVALMAE